MKCLLRRTADYKKSHFFLLGQMVAMPIGVLSLLACCCVLACFVAHLVRLVSTPSFPHGSAPSGPSSNAGWSFNHHTRLPHASLYGFMVLPRFLPRPRSSCLQKCGGDLLHFAFSFPPLIGLTTSLFVCTVIIFQMCTAPTARRMARRSTVDLRTAENRALKPSSASTAGATSPSAVFVLSPIFFLPLCLGLGAQPQPSPQKWFPAQVFCCIIS